MELQHMLTRLGCSGRLRGDGGDDLVWASGGHGGCRCDGGAGVTGPVVRHVQSGSSVEQCAPCVGKMAAENSTCTFFI